MAGILKSRSTVPTTAHACVSAGPRVCRACASTGHGVRKVHTPGPDIQYGRVLAPDMAYAGCRSVPDMAAIPVPDMVYGGRRAIGRAHYLLGHGSHGAPVPSARSVPDIA
eukprot:3416510-Rhodomonas_salina.6